jgi:P4 family phage/plasmid primase-like protien
MAESVLSESEPSLEELRHKLRECLIYDEKNKQLVIGINRPCVVRTLIRYLYIKTSVKADRREGILIYRNGRYEEDGDLTIKRLLASAFLDVTGDRGKSIYFTNEKNEILARIAELTPARDHAFDVDLSIINMANGLYNWKTGTFRGHTPDYPSRIQTPVRYDQNAKCPSIEKFFEIVFKPDDVPKIIEFIGYCLYRGYPVQKALILLGSGGTGKSIFIDIVKHFVGEENTFSVNPQDMNKDRFATADLYRKLLDAVPDVGSEKLTQTAAIKALTGHKDIIRAQRKNQDPFQFVNYAKMIFGLNTLPETSDRTSGWYRRIEMVRMEHVLGDTELSKEFIAKLTSPEELSGLFNLTIKELPGLLDRNTFTNETSREDAAEAYEAASRPMEYFCEHFLRHAPEINITKADLFEKYQAFCKAVGVPVPNNSNMLGRHLHQNVEWLINRPKKDEVERIPGSNNKSPVAVWPDTEFCKEEFEKCVESQKN